MTLFFITFWKEIFMVNLWRHNLIDVLVFIDILIFQASITFLLMFRFKKKKVRLVTHCNITAKNTYLTKHCKTKYVALLVFNSLTAIKAPSILQNNRSFPLYFMVNCTVKQGLIVRCELWILEQFAFLQTVTPGCVVFLYLIVVTPYWAF